jgi:hypothetical protein
MDFRLPDAMRCKSNLGLTSLAYPPLRLAHRAGVTTVIEAPFSYNLIQGISVAFRTGARHKLEAGAVPQREVALHARIIHDGTEQNAMVSTRVATLRGLLLQGLHEKQDSIYARVVKVCSSYTQIPFIQYFIHAQLQSQLPLVISVEKADIMATLIDLKAELESVSNATLHLVFAGATESHLIADEIAKAGVGVILAPLRSFPRLWDQKRL